MVSASLRLLHALLDSGDAVGTTLWATLSEPHWSSDGHRRRPERLSERRLASVDGLSCAWPAKFPGCPLLPQRLVLVRVPVTLHLSRVVSEGVRVTCTGQPFSEDVPAL